MRSAGAEAIVPTCDVSELDAALRSPGELDERRRRAAPLGETPEEGPLAVFTAAAV